MAKRKPKHDAPVAATKSDINGGLARIIELAAKWQAIGQWTQTLSAAKGFRRDHNELMTLNEMIHHDDRRLPTILDGKKLSRAERIAIQKKDEAKYGQMWDDVREYSESREAWSEQVADAERELLELQNLVRQHIPQLLECVPDVDFGIRTTFGVGFRLDLPEVDHASLRRDLRKLEGQALVLTLGVKAIDQPMQNDTAVAHKGISLLDAALLANEGDKVAAKATKNRWHSSRESKLPTPLGKEQGHSQRNLYNPDVLLEFIKIVDPDSLPRVRSGYVGHLKPVAKTV